MQTKIILILTIALILVGGSAAFLSRQYKIVKEERDQAIEFNNARTDSLRTFKLLNGQLGKRAEVAELSARNATKLLEDERLSFVKQFTAVNKKLKNLEQASRTEAVASGVFDIPLIYDAPPVIPLDSIDWSDITFSSSEPSIVKAIDWAAYYPERTFDNHNEWFRIKGKVTADTITVIPQVPITMESVLLWERTKKFLFIRYGPKKYYSETSCPNPYVEILSHEVTKVRRK